MKKITLIIVFLIATGYIQLYPQASSGIQAYLVTCAPGTETYSIYGHSALRIVNPNTGSDSIYNWGVFDFSTPHFALKFAKGRLDYMLDINSPESFVGEYIYEKRSVYEQRINLEPDEMAKLLALLEENLKPENVKYRYDFFYDDCSTRIRDILEKSLGSGILYPPEEKNDQPTFREKVGKYQQQYPWLKLGIDLIMGRAGERKTTFRDRMFLPIDLQTGLSQALVNRNGRMVQLLQNPEILIQFDQPVIKSQFYTTPVFLFTLLLVLITILLSLNRKKKFNRILDLLLFTVFSALSLLMIFFNFFTDHIEMRWNLNIIWLSPFVLICLTSLILNKEWKAWFRTVFFLCLISLLIQLFFPGGYNTAVLPLTLILMLRSAARAGFSWNPLSLDSI
jgi:hypothetical protein